MQKKLTITIDVDDDLHAGVDMRTGYAAMAADEIREREAAAWSEGTIGDVAAVGRDTNLASTLPSRDMAMKAFSFQLRLPANARLPVRSEVAERLRDIISHGSQIYGSSEGQEEGWFWITLTARTKEPCEYWRSIKEKLAAPSGELIAVCEGDEDWNHYLLLHHFDEGEELDELSDDYPI